jgi:hypothetical protein
MSPPGVIARRVLCVGLPQHGKTVLCERLVNDRLREFPTARALVWDVVREQQYHGQACHSLSDFAATQRQRRHVFRGEVKAVEVAQLALDLTAKDPSRRVLLVIDEMALKQVVNNGHWASEALRLCSSTARGVDLYCTTQLPKYAPTDLRGTMTDCYAFRLDDQDQLDRLVELGMPARYQERVRRLRPWCFVHYRRW